MKNSVIFLMVATLLCSCSMDGFIVPQEEDIDDERVLGGSEPLNLGVHIVITNEKFDDRLNPKSPAYFGDDFFKGIEVLYLCDGEKLPYLQYFYKKGYNGGLFWRDNIENYNPVMPISPKVLTADYKTLGPDNYNYYMIDCTSEWGYFEEDGKSVSYVYIRYPNGSEDEIKTMFYRGEKSPHKYLWFNGELVFSYFNELIENPVGIIYDCYYFNPKFFPWMKPDLNDEGIQVGVVPAFGAIWNTIVVKK